MRILISMLGLSLLMFPKISCAETGISASEIRFGSCVPLSGDNKINGIAYQGGAKAYFDYLNAEKGGINGRKVNFIVLDDGYDVDMAVACYKQLIEKAVFATGIAIGTPTGAKYALMAENNKIPFIANGGGPSFMHEPLRKHVFAVRASYVDEMREGVDHLWAEAGARKFGVIFQNDALGSSGLDAVKAALSAHGAAPVAIGSYVRNTTDIEAAYATVKAANPDVVYIPGVTVPISAVLKKAKADGWKPIFVPMPARDTQLIEKAGPAAEGIVIGNATPIIDQVQLPTVALYHKAMKKYAPDVALSGAGLQSFVDALIISEGMKRAGKDMTRDSFIEKMESLSDFDSGLGSEFRVHYSATDHKAFDKMYFSTIQGGKVVPLKDWKALKH